MLFVFYEYVVVAERRCEGRMEKEAVLAGRNRGFLWTVPLSSKLGDRIFVQAAFLAMTHFRMKELSQTQHTSSYGQDSVLSCG